MRKCGVLLLVPLVFGCNNVKDKETITSNNGQSEASQIVSLSIENHGGLENWQNLKSISFSKATILFDSTGKQESSIVQKHFFSFKPELDGSIEWIEKGDSLKIVFKKGDAVKYINNQPDKDSGNTSRNAFMASLYVLFQPFKLMDAGTNLKYVGIDSLDGRTVNIVKPVYQGAKAGDDQWLFYFDKNSNELIANLVNHNGKFSLIKNLAFDYTSSIKLHQHRKSYFVDDQLNVLYLRAEYFYMNYQVDFEE